MAMGVAVMTCYSRLIDLIKTCHAMLSVWYVIKCDCSWYVNGMLLMLWCMMLSNVYSDWLWLFLLWAWLLGNAGVLATTLVWKMQLLIKKPYISANHWWFIVVYFFMVVCCYLVLSYHAPHGPVMIHKFGTAKSFLQMTWASISDLWGAAMGKPMWNHVKVGECI